MDANYMENKSYNYQNVINRERYEQFFRLDNWDFIGNYHEIFKNDITLGIISPDGEFEEIEVKMNDFYRRILHERFVHLPGVTSEDEYLTATIAAKNGYVVIIGNECSLSFFLPSVLNTKVYATLMHILEVLGHEKIVYCGVAMEQEMGMDMLGSSYALSIGETRDLVKDSIVIRCLNKKEG